MTRLIRYIILMIAAAALGACSTTKRIADDDALYDGMKLKIEGVKGEKVPSGLKGEISKSVAVKPNNPWPMTNIRNPFPIGLWIWNHWSGHKHGLKHWVYDKWASEPVLISDVRPDLRTKMIDQVLENNGYFHGSADYQLSHGRNHKIETVTYTVKTGPAFLLDTIEMLPDTNRLAHLIDSVASKIPYLRPGNRYSVDSLASARTKIASVMRNRGYYYFSPEFIEYLADSIQNPGHIALRLTVASNLPPAALREYKTGKITMIVRGNSPAEGNPDTIQMDRATLIRYFPSHFRNALVDECIVPRPGRRLTLRGINNTQTRLSRLGIFSNIDINVHPTDSTAIRRGSDILDVTIDCTLDAPWEARLEANVSSKSNSYLGPGLIFGVTNRNIFGGGEQLSVTLTGSYEWQTGRRRSSVFNSYEIGLQGSLAFPRLLAPKFLPRLRRDLSWTRITLNADLLNRPHYFRMAQFNASYSYDWNPTRYSSNTLTLLKLTYTNLLKTTAEFDEMMEQNRAIAESFRSQFLPQIMYTYNYDRMFGPRNSLNWTVTAQEAGGVFCGLWRLCGQKHEKKLFGIPISQFFKVSGQLVYGRRLGVSDTWLFGRVASGVAHAYGNSSQVPYSEQFWVGGANSVRAFTVRSLGPGSYRPKADRNGNYFDQTGTFKFEANLELRFPIIGPVHGAVFLDAGNVWLLKADPERPGGQLRAKTFGRDLALGTGAGIRVDIGMLVIRGDLGIGIHAPYETSRHGYYNMTSFKNSLAFHLAIGYPF
ncbi:MAG: BamA/TamA family outer membrane protein [Muribaculaceae bacterium]|nr:BamA/TamA family outer membrane protein [Muribaculaceae bacterium]